jgi:hypothetical protein
MSNLPRHEINFKLLKILKIINKMIIKPAASSSGED